MFHSFVSVEPVSVGTPGVRLVNGVLTINSNVRQDQFRGRADIKEVIIKDGVTTIGEFAFFECSSLTSVTLPAGLQTIGEFAFFECSSLTSVTLPAGLQTIWRGHSGSAVVWPR